MGIRLSGAARFCEFTVREIRVAAKRARQLLFKLRDDNRRLILGVMIVVV
jgi:hypothetical protein